MNNKMELNELQQLNVEFIRELEGTKKLFNALPEEQMDYKPHEKSMSTKALASHIADLSGWPAYVLTHDSLDFATDYNPSNFETKDDLLKGFKSIYLEVEKVFNETELEELSKTFMLKSGDYIIMEDTKLNTIRYMINNHVYHHRGQLTVYLRLLDLPVPGLYGPSADER